MTAATIAAPATRRLSWWEIAAGIVLPVASAAAQVAALHEDIVGPWLSWGYAPLGILALLASARCWPNPVLGMLVCGANLGSTAGALLIAADHFLYSYFFVWPFTLVTLVVAPVLSARVYARRAFMLLRQAAPLRWTYVLIGALAVFAPPAAAQYAETRWRVAIDWELVAGDTATVAAGLHALNRYPLRLGRFDNDVCEWVVLDRSDVWDNDTVLTAELTKLLGPDFHHCMPRDPHG